MASIERRESDEGPRFDVRFRVDGEQRKRTFKRRLDAENYKRRVESDELAGLVIDPRGSEVRFAAYARNWLGARLSRGRPLSPTTVQGYRDLLRRLIEPAFGTAPLRKITPERVRAWHSGVVASKNPDQAAKAYRLLRAILNTALADELIGRNPCRIKGAGASHTAERPMPETATVLELADAMPERLRALVLLAGFVTLHTGEALGLERRDVDPLRSVVEVRREAVQVSHVRDESGAVLERRGRVVKSPKSEAGTLSVAVPRVVMRELEDHLARYVAADPGAPVFAGENGLPVSRREVPKAWRAACATVGIVPWSKTSPRGVRLHDLRHHAGTMAARTEATTKEIMRRMGHTTPRAALIYQHATDERDQAIARHLDEAIAAAQREQRDQRPVLVELVCHGRAMGSGSDQSPERQNSL
jgi:hypothetical protein